MELYKFQKEAIEDLCACKRFAILGTVCGKSAIMMRWLARQKPKKVLITTTPSKRDSKDFIRDADTWNGNSWRKDLQAFEVVSWNGLAKWVYKHNNELDEWVYGFDEVQKAKAGVSSAMGKAFLKITINSSIWAGFTATPGDNWLHFYPYFTACGFVPNKTNFKRRFAIEQNFKGFPEIVGWVHEDILKNWWKQISTTPDTSQMFDELPSETHKVIEFKKPKGYDQLRKTRVNEKGEFIETTMGLCHALREMSFTKEKKQWLEDFIEGLGTQAVLFYNYIEEGDIVESIIKRARKDAKVWRIDGKHHDIPTADTIGKYDIVLCQWQSGSEALNLQFINYWVSITPTYSYITSTQARGRIKRIGQKRPMFFYYMKCDGIESAVYDALKNKKDFSEEVYINGGK
jgi:hypothetical protein